MKRSGFARCSLIQILALSALILPLAHSALAVSTLPCPNVGAQPPSTPALGAGLDNACESWFATQPGSDISAANLSSAAIVGTYSGANFTSTNFAGARLGASLGFGFGDYSGANFTNANFQNAIGDFSSFEDAVFTGANLAGTSFYQARLDRANLSGLDLRTTVFSSAKLADANLSFANLSGNGLSGGTRPSLFVRLDRTNFSNATMVGTTIAMLFQPGATGTLYTNADLTAAQLYLGSVVNVDLSGAILYQARVIAGFTGGSLRNADLEETDLSFARFRGTDLTGAFMSAGTNLNGTRYDAFTLFPSGATFVGPSWGLPGGGSPIALGMVADFNANVLSGLDYSSVDFMNAQMWSTVDHGTNFTNADLSNCDLRYSQLDGAVLTGANVTNATLLGVTYDEHTIFPSGQNYAVSPWGLSGNVTPWHAG